MIKSLESFYKTQEKLLKLIKKNQYIECSDFTNYIDHLLQLQDRGNIKVEFVKNTCKIWYITDKKTDISDYKKEDRLFCLEKLESENTIKNFYDALAFDVKNNMSCKRFTQKYKLEKHHYYEILNNIKNIDCKKTRAMNERKEKKQRTLTFEEDYVVKKYTTDQLCEKYQLTKQQVHQLTYDIRRKNKTKGKNVKY